MGYGPWGHKELDITKHALPDCLPLIAYWQGGYEILR